MQVLSGHLRYSPVNYMIIEIVFLLLIHGITSSSHLRYITGELDSSISLRCEIGQLPGNAVITWVYRPKIPLNNGIKWLPLYANARRLTQNNQRFIVDYSGYEERIRKHISILTINQLNLADEGTYMCKSNQHQSTANIFNVTVMASMKIYPKEGLIELNDQYRTINLTCTVEELAVTPLDPLRLKWYHKNHEIPHSQHSHLIHSHSHPHQASLILTIHHLSFNDSGVFKCIYDQGKLSKDVQLIYSSSVLSYSKSISSTRWSFSSFVCIFLPMIISILR